MRVIKSISSFCLLLAGLAIIAHMAIPHDHHLAISVNGIRESCDFSHEKSDHRPIFPVHCNAFNDLTTEKLSSLIVKQESQTGFVSIIWRPDPVIPGLYLLQTIVENTGKPFPDNCIPDSSPFRAPPFVC